jgi:hypothetical protein
MPSVQAPLAARLLYRRLDVLLVKMDAHENQGRCLFGLMGAGFRWFVFAFDDQFDGGVADLFFSVMPIAHGDQVVAVAFDIAFGAVFAWLEAFYNIHIMPRWRQCPAGSLPSSAWRLKPRGVLIRTSVIGARVGAMPGLAQERMGSCSLYRR